MVSTLGCLYAHTFVTGIAMVVMVVTLVLMLLHNLVMHLAPIGKYMSEESYICTVSIVCSIIK